MTRNVTSQMYFKLIKISGFYAVVSNISRIKTIKHEVYKATEAAPHRLANSLDIYFFSK